MHRAAKLTIQERGEVLAPGQAAFDAFRRGMGTDAHWARLVDAINVGLELTRRQIASDHGPTFEAAGQALTAAFERGRREENEACAKVADEYAASVNLKL